MAWLLIIFIPFVILAGAGYYFARQVIYPRIHTLEKTYQSEVENKYFDEKIYQTWIKEDMRVVSIYGYTLTGQYFVCGGSQKTVVISHGITWNRNGSIKYASVFRRHGFNVLIYDLRNHGASGGSNTTFGYMEKYDLQSMVDWALDRLGPLGRVGTMGESLGAAISLQHAAIDPRVAFTIADCSFSDLRALLVYRLGYDFRLPAFPLINLANLFCELMSWMTFEQVSPLRDIPQVKTPVMFIHGVKDTYIPPWMSQVLYEAKTSGIRSMYLAPEAGHAKSLVSDRESYENKVTEFLLSIGLGQETPIESGC